MKLYIPINQWYKPFLFSILFLCTIQAKSQTYTVLQYIGGDPFEVQFSSPFGTFSAWCQNPGLKAGPIGTVYNWDGCVLSTGIFQAFGGSTIGSCISPPTSCINYSSGGSISGGGLGCSPYQPSIMNTVLLPSGGGGGGSLEYQWRYTIDSVNWNWIGGTNTASYTPPSINVTTQYQRCARRNCQSLWECSNVVTYTVTSSPQVTVYQTEATCGNNNGSITFNFVDEPSKTNIEFSLDGGSTYQPSIADSLGTYTYNSINPNTYNLWARWDDGSCPINLGNVTITNIPGTTDTDNDGVFDICDADDDNDGILDDIERFDCANVQDPFINPPIDGIDAIEPTIVGATQSYPYFDITYYESNSEPITVLSSGIRGIDAENPTNTVTYEFNKLLYKVDFALADLDTEEVLDVRFYDENNSVITNVINYISHQGSDISILSSTGNSIQVSSTVCGASTSTFELARYIRFYFGETALTRIEVDYLSECHGSPEYFLLNACAERDTDNDGTPDYLDLDSDNDGCSDAIEGDENIADANIVNDRIGGTIDSNGVPVLATNGQGIGGAQNASQTLGCDEICNNGVDDDDDGLIDCADSDCQPVISNINVTQPTCANKTGGQIVVTATGSGILEYSINNSSTYQANNTFSNLGIGQYTIRVRNNAGCVGVSTSNPVILDIPTCTEICDDGIDNDGDGLIDCDDPGCGNIGGAIRIDNN